MRTLKTYYTTTAHPAPSHPALQGDIEVDVCVVGGGIAGCSTALHLAQRGYRVALLEGQRIAWGASGRNGGQALTGYACGNHKLITQLGFDSARALWDLSVEALALLEQLIDAHNIDCDFHRGVMHAALKPRQAQELQLEQQELATRFGYSATRYLNRDQVRERLASDRYIAGLLDTGSGHLHPLNYTLGLAAAAEAAGVQIFENSHVAAINHSEPALLTTSQGRVKAKFVALCCNAYIAGLEPKLRARIMPVGTYIVATEPLGESAITALMRENIAVSDVNFVLDYFRRSADHRLLFGGRVSYSGVDAFDTARATRKRMLKVFPQLESVKIEHAWGGYVDITVSRAPDFGRLAPHIYYLQGFSGQGVALAGLAGKLVMHAIAGQAESFDLFTRLQHRNFPGGRLLRMPSLVLAMLWYRLRDFL